MNDRVSHFYSSFSFLNTVKLQPSRGLHPGEMEPRIRPGCDARRSLREVSTSRETGRMRFPGTFFYYGLVTETPKDMPGVS